MPLEVLFHGLVAHVGLVFLKDGAVRAVVFGLEHAELAAEGVQVVFDTLEFLVYGVEASLEVGVVDVHGVNSVFVKEFTGVWTQETADFGFLSGSSGGWRGISDGASL